MSLKCLFSYVSMIEFKVHICNIANELSSGEISIDRFNYVGAYHR